MDYYKYIKYKTKYLNLKYDNNQYGGGGGVGVGVVSCDKGYTNMLGTCWAISILMVLCFGHLTSDQLYTVMNKFKNNTVSLEEIKIHIEEFIKKKIEEIQGNTELTNAFAHYDIFKDDKIDFLKEILRKFIERYYNKVMDIPFIIKPLKYMLAPKDNPERCELKIAENYKNLFDTSHISKKINLGGLIYDDYLFCNLLSIFFLDYKVSFTNYYKNFSSIIFDDKNDLGILIIIHGHVCCLFICNGEEKFYDDTDKKIYNCNWIKLLQQGTMEKQLYIIENCLEFIDDIKTYKGNIQKISKVLYLTVISKHKIDTNLDIDIKRLLQFKDLGEIKDPYLQYILGTYYYEKQQSHKTRELYGLSAVQGYPRSQYNLGLLLYKGEDVEKDHDQAKKLFALAADQGDVEAMFAMGHMLYNGEGGVKDIVQAKKMAELAVKHGNVKAKTLLQLILDEESKKLDADTLYISGYDSYMAKNYYKARKMFTFAADKGHAGAQYELGSMLYNGEGGDKDDDRAKEMFSLAAAQDNADAIYMLGYMLYNKDDDVNDTIPAAKKMFELAAIKGNYDAQFMLGWMLYNGEGSVKDNAQAKTMLELANSQNIYVASLMLRLILNEMENKNLADAQYDLGYELYNLKKYKIARKMFTLAEKSGHATAGNMLETMSYYGEGV